MSATRGFPEAGRLAPWLMAALLIALGFYSTTAIGPEAAGADANSTEFSAARAMEHVEQIAQEPHPLGSSEIAEVRDYIVDRVDALGLEYDLQHTPAPDAWGNGATEVVNVIAWIPGQSNTRAVLLAAHYDTVPTTPGANDNSAAVATLLEVARALKAGPALTNDI